MPLTATSASQVLLSDETYLSIGRIGVLKARRTPRGGSVPSLRRKSIMNERSYRDIPFQTHFGTWGFLCDSDSEVSAAGLLGLALVEARPKGSKPEFGSDARRCSASEVSSGVCWVASCALQVQRKGGLACKFTQHIHCLPPSHFVFGALFFDVALS